MRVVLQSYSFDVFYSCEKKDQDRFRLSMYHKCEHLINIFISQIVKIKISRRWRCKKPFSRFALISELHLNAVNFFSALMCLKLIFLSSPYFTFHKPSPCSANDFKAISFTTSSSPSYLAFPQKSKNIISSAFLPQMLVSLSSPSENAPLKSTLPSPPERPLHSRSKKPSITAAPAVSPANVDDDEYLP